VQSEGMRKRTAAIGGGIALAAALVGGGVAAAGGFEPGEEGSHDYTEEQAAQASEAALEATDGGTVNEVELDDENGATWEVEVTKPDGTTVDVRLDESYVVVVIEGDSEDEPGDTDD
jgi:Peptidase propeptide and YPEB domain